MTKIEAPPQLTTEELKTLRRLATAYGPNSTLSQGITGEIKTFVDASADLETAQEKGDVKAERKAQRRLRRLEEPTPIQKFLKQAVPGAAMIFFAALIPTGIIEFHNTWVAAGVNVGDIAKAAGDIGNTFLHFNVFNPGSTIQRIANDFQSIQTTLLQTLPSRANELLRDTTEVVTGIVGGGVSALTQPWKAPRKRGRFPF